MGIPTPSPVNDGEKALGEGMGFFDAIPLW